MMAKYLFLLTIYSKEIGFTHMRILEGVGTIIQLAGLVARLCKLASSSGASTK